MTMNSSLNALRRHWFTLRTAVGRWPLHRKVGVIVAIVAVAGLVWIDHTNSQTPEPDAAPQTSASATTTDSEESPAEQDTAAGTYEIPGNGTIPVPDASVNAARGTAERFATNFGSPNGNFDDWYARISPDISLQLREQYRLTDIRNVAQNTVTKLLGPLNQLPGTMAFDIVYSDNSRIEVRVEMGVEGWQVINVVPLQENPAPAPAPAADIPAPAGQ